MGGQLRPRPDAVGVLLRRPSLLVEAFRSWLAFGRGVRATDYLEWRLHTAYGDASVIETPDLVHYLAWRRQMRRIARWERHS
jgi:hypothetical protein